MDFMKFREYLDYGWTTENLIKFRKVMVTITVRVG